MRADSGGPLGSLAGHVRRLRGRRADAGVDIGRGAIARSGWAVYGDAVMDDAPAGGRPIILLAFANDHAAGGSGYLRELAAEQRRVEAALSARARDVEVVVRTNTRVDDLYGLFARFNDRVVVFHYGGHAREDALLFEDDDPAPAAARITGIAERLGQLPRLALVFLNGCSTAPHVEVIRRYVAAPVIATDRAIVDSVARDFAHRFYDDLSAGRSIGEAFDSAASRVRAAVPEPSRATRMLRPAGHVTEGWPWALHAAAAGASGVDWRLSDAAGRPPTRWWPWVVAASVGLAAALAGVLLAGSPSTPVVDAGVAAPPTVEVDAGRRGPDPLAAPAADLVLDHLIARVQAGERPQVVAASMTDGYRFDLWSIVPVAWTRPGAAAVQLALVEEGLRRLEVERPPPSIEALARFGRLLRGVDVLAHGARPALSEADAEAWRRRIGAALRGLWPAPGAVDALRGPMVPLAPDAGVALGATEVTVGQLRALVPGYAPLSDPRLPVVEVDWFTARAFAEWLGARLPTRAELEQANAPLDAGGACRQGDAAALEAVAWFSGTARTVQPVGGKAPCRGLYDLRGNAAEWAEGPGPNGRWGMATAYGGHVFSGRSTVERRPIGAATPESPVRGYGLRLAVDRAPAGP